MYSYLFIFHQVFVPLMDVSEFSTLLEFLFHGHTTCQKQSNSCKQTPAGPEVSSKESERCPPIGGV